MIRLARCLRPASNRAFSTKFQRPFRSGDGFITRAASFLFVGSCLTGAGYIFHELYTSLTSHPTALMDQCLDQLHADKKVIQYLGRPLKVYARGAVVDRSVDVQGREHLRVSFQIEGPSHRQAKVHGHWSRKVVEASAHWECELLLVETMDGYVRKIPLNSETLWQM